MLLRADGIEIQDKLKNKKIFVCVMTNLNNEGLRGARMALLVAAVALACGMSVAAGMPKYGKVTERGAFINGLIKRMTLEEKVGQMNLALSTGDVRAADVKMLSAGGAGGYFGIAGADVTRRYQRVAVEQSRLGIPLLFGFDCIHGMRTIFPIPIATASSWDMDAIERAERVAAVEATACGVNWVFAPMVDIARDSRWGRTAEGAGEDPYLGSEVARARVRGFQGAKLSDKATAAVCVKHYVGYGACEGGRDYNTMEMAEGTLRNVYLPPFKDAVDAGAMSAMSAFNTYHGIPGAANEFLLRRVLKRDLKFGGFVVSDYDALHELIYHGVAADSAEAARISAKAGMDMDMMSGVYAKNLVAEVKRGAVDMKVIDEAVKRILGVKYDLGLFDNPYLYSDTVRERADLLTAEHLSVARDVARRSMVLLKNVGGVLPLGAAVKKIALIGEMANRRGDMNGCWGGACRDTEPVTIAEGLKSALPGVNITYVKGCNVLDRPVAASLDSVVNAARAADVVVMTMGEYGWMTGEAQSRADISIAEGQIEVMKAAESAGKPIVVLLTNGRALAMPYVAEHATAILETWILGTQAGNAIADVLTGRYNPSGKLPISFPNTTGEEPFYYNHLPTGRPSTIPPYDQLGSRYKDVPVKGVYPFGYGLSYTTFKYSRLATSEKTVTGDAAVTVSVDVENAGSIAGEEVVQLYVNDPVASVSQPVKSLKGFKKVMLAPGEKRTVTMTLTKDALRYYKEGEGWIVEPGEIKVMVGGNSENLLATTIFCR